MSIQTKADPSITHPAVAAAVTVTAALAAGIKTAWRISNNLRYAEDTTLMAESEEELKSLLMIHHFMANKWGNSGHGDRLYFLGLKNHCR